MRDAVGADIAPAARRAPPPDADRGARGWARTSSPTACSGWRTPRRPRTRSAFRLIRQHTDHAARGGRGLQHRSGTASELIENQLDRLHPRHRRARRRHHATCGASPTSAALYQVRTGCHGATDLSPVCMGAALHFDLWVPNFGIQEYMPPQRRDRRGVPARLHASRTASCTRARRRAMASRSTRRWPRSTRTSRAYLPVNRLQHDGTLWHW
ncbi:MAG: hypothetical protein MZW92_32500 [Comamonadaceae bacterium]|nr:hypothetical protein [Comamonadaceae bacterium]